MAAKLTDRERFLRRVESLALSALPITSIVAAPPAHHDGVMIALVPDEPENLALDHPEALTADDLHITLCYLGKVQDLSSFDKTEILTKARQVVGDVSKSFTANPDGVVVMGKNEDGVPATALLVQSDDIVKLYEAMAEAVGYESKFPSFIPHMTTGYGVPVEMAQDKVGQDIEFSNVLVKFGDARHLLPFATSIVAAPKGANTIDRVMDSLGRLWDEALHPRDGEGKFIKKNGAISGKLSVPTANRKGVNVIDANRASVVGFRTIDNEVWVLAEVTNPDGTKVQGFAKADEIMAVAPVKARLDALYPISNGPDVVDSTLERSRQLDLILEAVNSEFGPDDDKGAMDFLDTLGLNDTDLDYIYDGDNPDFLGGIRKVDRQLTPDELDEQESIINDAMQVKVLRERVHGLQNETHEVPTQKLVTTGPDEAAVETLRRGADPLTIQTTDLLGAMRASGRFDSTVPTAVTGISAIEWLTDANDQTEHSAYLAGLSRATNDRAFFVKTSIMGAEFGNTDIVHEVLATLISDAVKDSDGGIEIPRSVFGDNPEWDGGKAADDFIAHQPGHVVSQHAAYLVPADWEVTDMFTEKVNLQNDVKTVKDDLVRADMEAAFNEDMGNLYGNDAAAMILLDYATMNGDRNANNALLATNAIGTEGRIIPIDHGMAFDQDPFDSDDPELTSGDLGSLYFWFMKYKLTSAWLDIVRGGLDMNDNVTEASIRQIIADFVQDYSNLDSNDIVEKFSAIPGVTDAQIERVRSDLAGVMKRVEWLFANQDAVFDGLTGRGTR